MLYNILFDEFTDLSGKINRPAVMGGIWVPPPSVQQHGSASPRTPDFTATVTSAPDQPATLTFPALAGPPTGDSAMLISEPSFGDIYRLAVAPPPDSPAHLQGLAASSTVTQAELSELTAGFTAQTFQIPGWVQSIYVALTAGTYVPDSATISTVALTLPPAGAAGFLTLTLTGTMAITGWWWTNNQPFTFTEHVTLAAAGDPVNARHVLAAAGSSQNLTVHGGWVLKPLTGKMGDLATQALEDTINLALPAQVNQEAQKQLGLELSPQAVISAGPVTMTPAGLTLTFSVADIFGPALIPIPPPVFTTVPDVIGFTVRKAGDAMRAAHLRMTTSDAGSPVSQTVIRIVDATDPEPGTSVVEGTLVTAYLKSRQ